MGEKDRKRGKSGRERNICRETGVGERDTGEKERVEKDTERERKRKREREGEKKKIHGILSCRASLRRTE